MTNFSMIWAQAEKAILDDAYDIIKDLIGKHANIIIERNDDGQSLLHIAASEGKLGIAKLIVEKGGDVNAKDSDGAAPLSDASFNGRAEVVKYLISLGANIDAKDIYGRTALWYAQSWGHPEVAAILLDSGADVANSFKPKTTEIVEDDDSPATLSPPSTRRHTIPSDNSSMDPSKRKKFSWFSKFSCMK